MVPQAGWQSFDPTAQVPLAPPDPGAVLLADIGRSIAGLAWGWIGTVAGSLAACALGFLAGRRRRRRPKLWVERVTAELERRGAAAGAKRRPAETLGEYAGRLGALGRWRAGSDAAGALQTVVALVERAAYGAFEPDKATRTFVEEVVRGLHPARRIGTAGRRRLRTA